jgi:hypothetical protein
LTSFSWIESKMDKMKKLVSLIGLLAVLASCGGNQTENPVTQNNSDSVIADTILTVSAMMDGPDDDQWFYVMFPDTLNLDGIKEIHLVPFYYNVSEPDSSIANPYMISIAQSDYEFYEDEFKSYSGKVSVFYDGLKKIPVTQYALVNGLPEGEVDVYNPDGKTIISRIYEAGVCTKVTTDVYASDWTFNPKNSVLMIENVNAHQTLDENGVPTIHIGPSIHASLDGSENSQYDLIRSDVFENFFMVNGGDFTGCLLGYFPISSLESERYFEMNFVGGKLNDTIRVYGPWGLELEEVYSNGERLEVLYKTEEMDGMGKPVIYLYPETEISVNVQLDLKGKITHSYPKYPAGGWNVKAQPDGTLYDENGKEFYALFWEGISPQEFTYNDGFVVKGSETEKFLESSLDIIGLTRREANEFIMFWLPQMENNAYNLIHFSTNEYEEIAQLKISPKPESWLRIMMVWSPLDQQIEIPQQNLYDLRVERHGFAVVEWGGKKQPFLMDL